MVVRVNQPTFFRPHPNHQYCRHNVDLNELCDECGPPDDDADDDEISDDERILRLVERDLHTGIVGEVSYRPLTWVRDKPSTAGWRCARMPGASGHTIVCIKEDKDGELFYGVSQVAWSRVADSSLEWGSCEIRAPR